MEVVDHVDIAGDDSIQELLDDPRNFNLRAIRAETLLDWIPDLGQYAAPCECRSHNGVFRTIGLAGSGIPGILRHRFFMAEEAERIVGERYIGLLIYDSREDDYLFELSAGSVTIGAVRPSRHDNRRHLIIASVPANILGGNVPFTVRALGKGPCYLESVLFMPTCPEPSAQDLSIQRISTRLVKRCGEYVDAEIHCVTSAAATVSVKAVPDSDRGNTILNAGSEVSDALHVVPLRELKSGTLYAVEIRASDKYENNATASTQIDTTEDGSSHKDALTIPVEFLKTGSAIATGLPVTFGLPVAKGVCNDPMSAFICCEGEEMPAQTRVHVKWPDGSVRWVLVDTVSPSALEKQDRLKAEVSLGFEPIRMDHGLKCLSEEGKILVEGERIRVTVTRSGPLPVFIESRSPGGGWRTAVTGTDRIVTGRLGNGLILGSAELEGLVLEEEGAERAVIRYEVPVRDEKGICHFRCTFRLHVYSGQPFVRLVCRAVLTSPAPGAAFGSNDLDHITPALEHVRSAVEGTEGETSSLLNIGSLEINIGNPPSAKNGHRRIVHEHDRGYRVENGTAIDEMEGHWSGFITLDDRTLAVCFKDFWQNYPKAVRCDHEGITLEMLPALSGDPLPGFADDWHKLYFWCDKDGKQYRLKVGTAMTSEILLGSPDRDEDVRNWLEWLERPPVVRPEANYLNETKVLLPMASKEESARPDYERMVDESVDVWLGKVEARHEYGFANFGDTYADEAGMWSNSEYDSAYRHYLEFLRGGDSRWFLLGKQAARHLLDVDTCGYSRVPEQTGTQYTHAPGHAGGYLPPYFRSKSGGSSSKPSHMWVEGPVLHYLLTGDEGVASTLRQTGKMLTRNLAFYHFNNARECGWHLVHLSGLARMTDDPRYLNAASVIVSRVLEKQEPGGGWEHPLAEAHCHCEPPRCRGEAGFMVGVLISGLRRYFEMTYDPQVAEAIVGGVKWLIEKTYDHEAGDFRYTSCPNRGGPLPDRTQMVMEALVDAYRFSRESLIGDIISRRAEEVLVMGVKGNSDKPYGVGLREMRYIPTLLHTLAGLDSA